MRAILYLHHRRGFGKMVEAYTVCRYADATCMAMVFQRLLSACEINLRDAAAKPTAMALSNLIATRVRQRRRDWQHRRSRCCDSERPASASDPAMLVFRSWCLPDSDSTYAGQVRALWASTNAEPLPNRKPIRIERPLMFSVVFCNDSPNSTGDWSAVRESAVDSNSIPTPPTDTGPKSKVRFLEFLAEFGGSH